MSAENDPRNWSIAYLMTLSAPGCGLSVGCERCRILKSVDLVSLALLKGENARLGDLKFKCQVCGSPGHPVASWWNGGIGSCELSKGRFNGQPPPKPSPPPSRQHG